MITFGPDNKFSDIPNTSWRTERLISKALCDLIEKTIASQIEKIDGHPPIPNLVKKLGRCVIFPNGARVYTYRGQIILKVPPDCLQIDEKGKVSFNLCIPEQPTTNEPGKPESAVPEN